MSKSDICPVELISWLTRWSKRRHGPDTRKALSCLAVTRAVGLPEFQSDYIRKYCRQSIWSASLCPHHSKWYSWSCHYIGVLKPNCLVRWSKYMHHFIIYYTFPSSNIHSFIYSYYLFTYLLSYLLKVLFIYLFITFIYYLFLYIFY